MMKKHSTTLYYIVLLVLMLVFAIYTASKFPYTYITMEGDDFWVLTKDFWHLKLATLPAVTMWLTDYLTQSYGSLYIAATIQTLVLGLIGVLAHAVLRKAFHNKPLYWLGLLPPVLLGYYCTFSLSFQLQWVFFLALLLIYLFIPNVKGSLFWSILSVLLGFFLMRTPLLAILLVCQALLAFRSYGAKKCAYWLIPLVLLGVAPLAYSQQVAFIPFEQRYTDWGTYFDPLTSRYNQDGECVKKCVCLSNEERWEDLLYREHVKSDARRLGGAALRYALLAESALGTLPENLLDYPIQDENLFLYPHEQNVVAQQLNRLFYLNLGIYDEAFHQAQEYSLLQHNGNCFSSLRQMVDYSIEEGEWEIAEKYLQVLSKSSRHKQFVQERRAKMAEQQRLGVKDIPYRADNFVGGYPLPVEMLRLARYYGDPAKQKKMLDYAICSYLIRGDANSFQIVLNAFDIYKDKPLPKAYQMFLERCKN